LTEASLGALPGTITEKKFDARGASNSQSFCAFRVMVAVYTLPD